MASFSAFQQATALEFYSIPQRHRLTLQKGPRRQPGAGNPRPILLLGLFSALAVPLWLRDSGKVPWGKSHSHSLAKSFEISDCAARPCWARDCCLQGEKSAPVTELGSSGQNASPRSLAPESLSPPPQPLIPGTRVLRKPRTVSSLPLGKSQFAMPCPQPRTCQAEFLKPTNSSGT